eukprot:12339601-Alexandrium_andersonii.AAC.2
MTGQLTWSNSCLAWRTAQASATESRPSEAGGKASRAVRPSSATLAAQSADDAPGGQPKATCTRASRTQHLAAASVARSAGRPPDRPRSTWRSFNSARMVPSTDAACSTWSRRSKSLVGMLPVGRTLGPEVLLADPAEAVPACHFSKAPRRALALA